MSDYGLSPEKSSAKIEAPLPIPRPPRPRSSNPGIGLVGAGGISEFHLRAYRNQGFRVAAIASRTRAKAEARRDEFFPDADVTTDYRDLLDRDDVEVLDVTPHPEDRLPILRDALRAGKHVLSQKPFVLDLDQGEELVRLARDHGVRLAVNQNGRWAPHFQAMREAVAAGLIGDVTSVDCALQWDQTWIAGNEAFERIHHLVLFDFAIHWFDNAACLLADREPQRVFASASGFPGQAFRPPALASAFIEYPGAQVRFSFHAHTRLGEEDVTTVVGTRGTLRSRGPGLNDQPALELFLEEGHATLPLPGCWFENGFEGAMGELLCAIEEDRVPAHDAADNLRSLGLCFAALASADSGSPVSPGSCRSLPASFAC